MEMNRRNLLLSGAGVAAALVVVVTVMVKTGKIGSLGIGQGAEKSSNTQSPKKVKNNVTKKRAKK